MIEHICTSCGKAVRTYSLREGKCRICLRTEEDNAHDLDMLTDAEYLDIVGEPRGHSNVDTDGNYTTKKQRKAEKKKEELLSKVRELSDEDFAEILKQLGEQS